MEHVIRHIGIIALYAVIAGVAIGIVVAIMKMDNVLNRRRAKRWLEQVKKGNIQLTSDTLRMYHDITTRPLTSFPGMNAVSRQLEQHPLDLPDYRVLYVSMYDVNKLFLFVECSYDDFIPTGRKQQPFTRINLDENYTRDVKKKEYHRFGLEFDAKKNELRAVSSFPDKPEQRGMFDRFGMALLEKVVTMKA